MPFVPSGGLMLRVLSSVRKEEKRTNFFKQKVRRKYVLSLDERTVTAVPDNGPHRLKSRREENKTAFKPGRERAMPVRRTSTLSHREK